MDAFDLRDANPFRTDGRLGRLRFLAFTALWNALLYAVLIVAGLPVDLGIVSGESSAALGLLPLLAALLAVVATLGYTVRRLHDLDKSGWWALTALLPVANFVLAVVLLLDPATPAPRTSNRYGHRAGAR